MPFARLCILVLWVFFTEHSSSMADACWTHAIVEKHYCQAYWWLRTGIFHIHIAKNSHDSSQPMPFETLICHSHLNIPDPSTPSLICALVSPQPWWKNCIAWTPGGRSCWRLASLGSAWLRFVFQEPLWSIKETLSSRHSVYNHIYSLITHCCGCLPSLCLTLPQCHSAVWPGQAWPLSFSLSLEKVDLCLCFLAGVIWHLSLAHDVVAVYASGDACQKGHRRDRGGRGGGRVKTEEECRNSSWPGVSGGSV